MLHCNHYLEDCSTQKAQLRYHHHYHHHQPTTSICEVATDYEALARVLGDLEREREREKEEERKGERERVCVCVLALAFKEFMICRIAGRTGILGKDRHLIFPCM